MKEQGIFALGTVRADRLKVCPVDKDSVLKKKGRGTYAQVVDFNFGITAVTWVDDSVVKLASNLVGIEPMDTIERWDKTEKKKVNVNSPEILREYNKSIR